MLLRDYKICCIAFLYILYLGPYFSNVCIVKNTVFVELHHQGLSQSLNRNAQVYIATWKQLMKVGYIVKFLIVLCYYKQ